MAISFLVLFAVPGCFSCNARTLSKSRAKVVEEYVVSANFDENADFPQLSDRGRSREIYQEDETRSRPETEGLPPRGGHGDGGAPPGAFHRGHALEERDYLVHHHHLPPAPHPPPPPPPAGLAYAPSLYAVGFITFLILLNSLQTSLLILKSKGSLLGPVTGVLGRRKRFASENAGELLESQAKVRYNSTTTPTSFRVLDGARV